MNRRLPPNITAARSRPRYLSVYDSFLTVTPRFGSLGRRSLRVWAFRFQVSCQRHGSTPSERPLQPDALGQRMASSEPKSTITRPAPDCNARATQRVRPANRASPAAGFPAIDDELSLPKLGGRGSCAGLPASSTGWSTGRSSATQILARPSLSTSASQVDGCGLSDPVKEFFYRKSDYRGPVFYLV